MASTVRPRHPIRKYFMVSEEGQALANLKANSVISDWLASVKAQRTKKGYLWGVNEVLKASQTTPSEIIRIDKDELKLYIRRTMSKHEKESQRRQIYWASLSFFSYYNKEVRLRRSETPKLLRTKASIEVIPTAIDVYRMIDVCRGYKEPFNYRNPAIVSFLFHSGVRIGTAMRLKYSDVKDDLYPSMNIPVRIKVTQEMDTKISAYGLGYYYTFLQKEAAEALRQYIDYRKKKGWHPKDGDYVFVEKNNRSLIRNYETIWFIVKNSAKKAGLKSEGIWARCLRKSFRKVLNASPLIDEDTKEALMGHKLPGSRGNYFDSHDIKEIGAKYMLADFGRSGVNLLQKELDETKARLQELEQGREQIEAKYITELKNVKEYFDGQLEQMKAMYEMAAEVQQKVVNVSELESYLAKGWLFKQSVNHEKSIVERKVLSKEAAIEQPLPKNIPGNLKDYFEQIG